MGDKAGSGEKVSVPKGTSDGAVVSLDETDNSDEGSVQEADEKMSKTVKKIDMHGFASFIFVIPPGIC